MRILILLSFIVCAFTCSAQHGYSYFFDKTPTVSTGDYKLKVIDMRPYKDDIGYLKTGAFNRMTAITLADAADKLFGAHFKKDIKPGIESNKELLLVLHHLRIEDRPVLGEMGTVHFDGDFYCGEPGKLIFLSRMDSIYEVSAAMDVTQKLLEMSELAINYLVLRAVSLAPDAKSDVYLTEEQAGEKRKADKLRFPIYNTNGIFKKGIYYTVDQFLSNQPVDTPFIESPLSGGTNAHFAFYYPNKKGRMGERIDVSSYFAIYDGKQWAVAQESRAALMHYKNGEFFAAKDLTGLANNAGAMMLGGLVGTLISSGRAGHGLYDTKFDPLTKEFMPFKRLQ
ncbi:MAG: hypothetical protein H7257_14055 [Taibaiella sp.]|nr:hypothetical protein [Taibaiella sp.]